MSREVITRDTIEQLRRDGITEHVISEQAIVTDAAADYALDQGIRLVRGTAAADRGSREGLAAEVRAGVIARLGNEPAGLDAAIAKVMGQQ